MPCSAWESVIVEWSMLDLGFVVVRVEVAEAICSDTLELRGNVVEALLEPDGRGNRFARLGFDVLLGT